jgi:hypothetical protein
MKLSDAERAMLDGCEGAAKQKAMDLLVRYGEALGAERLVETHNVAGAFNASTPSVRALVARGYDAVYSELNLDSRGRADPENGGEYLPAHHRHRQRELADSGNCR